MAAPSSGGEVLEVRSEHPAVQHPELPHEGIDVELRPDQPHRAVDLLGREEKVLQIADGGGDPECGVEGSVTRCTQTVSKTAGAQERELEVGAVTPTPGAEGLAHIFVRRADVGARARDIEEPGEAQGRVEQEALGFPARPAPLSLQQIVHQAHREAGVIDSANQCIARGLGHHPTPPRRQGIHEAAHQPVVELAHAAVERLEGIGNLGECDLFLEKVLAAWPLVRLPVVPLDGVRAAACEYGRDE